MSQAKQREAEAVPARIVSFFLFFSLSFFAHGGRKGGGESFLRKVKMAVNASSSSSSFSSGWTLPGKENIAHKHEKSEGGETFMQIRILFFKKNPFVVNLCMVNYVLLHPKHYISELKQQWISMSIYNFMGLWKTSVPIFVPYLCLWENFFPSNCRFPEKNQFSLPNHNAPIVEVSKKEEEEKEEETNNFSLPTKCTQNAESESELGINRNRKKI